MLTLPSHAKINLWLRILGRRPDGFHEVDTLMLPIGLADDLVFDELPGSRIELACSDPALPTDSSNLARRAGELLQKRHAPSRGARISLVKRIPLGAGLGGGSSNASTVLAGLSRLWKLDLPDTKIEKLSAEIGSDAPFFVRNRPALCTGRGELLTSVTFPRELPILLLNLGFGSATAWAYQNLGAAPVGSASQTAPPAFEAARHAFLAKNPDTPLGDLLLNNLEKPVFRKFPILALAKEFLAAQRGVRGAMMSGSGSTLFALLESPDIAANLATTLRARFGDHIWIWDGFTLPSSAH